MIIVYGSRRGQQVIAQLDADGTETQRRGLTFKYLRFSIYRGFCDVKARTTPSSILTRRKLCDYKPSHSVGATSQGVANNIRIQIHLCICLISVENTHFGFLRLIVRNIKTNRVLYCIVFIIFTKRSITAFNTCVRFPTLSEPQTLQCKC